MSAALVAYTQQLIFLGAIAGGLGLVVILANLGSRGNPKCTCSRCKARRAARQRS